MICLPLFFMWISPLAAVHLNSDAFEPQVFGVKLREPESFNDLDAIYVLSGGVQETDSGEIIAGSFETIDFHGFVSEFQSRSQAASLIWYQNPKIKVIASGAILPYGPKNSKKAFYCQINKEQLTKDGIRSVFVSSCSFFFLFLSFPLLSFSSFFFFCFCFPCCVCSFPFLFFNISPSSGAILPYGPKNSKKAFYCQINKEQLIKDGIRSDSIIESPKAVDTVTELVSLIEFISQFHWKKILVIGDHAQMERINLLWEIIQNYPLNQDLSPIYKISVNFFSNRLLYRKEQLLTPIFLNQLSNFKILKTKVNFLSSKEIIEHFMPEKKMEFEKIYKSENMVQRKKAEKKGVEDILKGNYYKPKEEE